MPRSFTGYSDCNVFNGSYFCSCSGQANCSAIAPSTVPNASFVCNMSSGCEWSDLADSCLVFNCLNLTSAAECQHSYHNCSWDGVTDKCTRAGPPPPACEPARVGRLNLSAVSWGAGHAHSVIDWWHLNTLQKMQGMWFDTPRTAYCDPRAPQDPCSWRVVAAVKKIQKNCSDASISAAVMGAGMCIT